MRSLLGALACAILAVMGATLAVQAGDAPPPPQGPIHVTIFYEVRPDGVNQAATMLKQYRDAAKGEQGATSVTIYQEDGAPTRFVSYEVWGDMAAYQAHSKAGSTSQLAERMKAIQFAPPDPRPHAIHFGGPEGKAAAGSVTFISHLDVPPAGLPQLLELMKPMYDTAAKDKGLVTYRILRQTAGARNHFRHFEIWGSEKDWEAHNRAKHTQTFRTGMHPLLGTPYDQRKYTTVN
jgi:quinol monooxygenase YgiN